MKEVLLSVVLLLAAWPTLSQSRSAYDEVAAKMDSLTQYFKSDARFHERVDKKIDSIYLAHSKELVALHEKYATSIKEQRDADLEKQNNFWKDKAFLFISLLGGLLALAPITFAIVEWVKSRAHSKMTALQSSLAAATIRIGDFEGFQYYQEYYFEHVLKPTVSQITDVLADIGKDDPKLQIEIAKVTEQFYDFERVINLLHYDSVKKAEAERDSVKARNDLKEDLRDDT